MADGKEATDLSWVAEARELLRVGLESFEAACLHPEQARAAMERFAEIERLAAAGKVLAAVRVQETGAWRSGGSPSAAHALARASGSSLRAAVSSLETARRLEELPLTEAALRAGELSEAEANEIASAAAARPVAERELLGVADRKGLGALREECRRVRAEGEAAAATYRQIRANRYLRHWSDEEGALRLEGRLPPDDGAKVLAALSGERNRIFAEARAAGRREHYDAYTADALVALAEADTAGSDTAVPEGGGPEGGGDASRGQRLGPPPPRAPGDPGPGAGNAGAAKGRAAKGRAGRTPGRRLRRGPRAMVHVRVDHAALVRGCTADGEVCEIPGVGPIPVAAARALAADSILKVLVTKAHDVVAVAHAGRSIPAHIRTAIYERDLHCTVVGCTVRDHLEIDHIIPWAEGGPSELWNLRLKCRFHHHLKTYCGWVDGGEPGAWTLTPPPDEEDEEMVR